MPTPSRSPRLARAVLLGACGAGLAGLAITSTPTATSATVLSVSPAAVSSLVAEPAAPHAPDFLAQQRAAAQAARERAQARAERVRASRSRAQAIAKVKARKAAAARAAAAPRWVRPSFAGIVSSYGPRWGRMHKGVDFGAGTGSPIRAIGDGVVIGSGLLAEESGYGRITLIRHSNGFVSAYAHQSATNVAAGDRVEAGEVIGYVGSTGHVTGPHLHFEIRTATHGGQVNPVTWLREHGVSV